MNLTRLMIHAVLHSTLWFRKLTATGTFGRQKAHRLDGPEPAGNNSLKAALMIYHEKQLLEASCSVATVVSSVNAIRSVQNGKVKRITQWEILDRVRTVNWKERMSDSGYRGRRGLPLALLGKVVECSLDLYNVRYRSVDVVQACKAKASKPKRQELKRHLLAFEKKGDRVIIAHFDQGAFLPVLNIPHISAVGGYRPESRQVTLLDVDPAQEVPYRVDFDLFYKGLSNDYCGIFKPFGYESGGYVLVRLR